MSRAHFYRPVTDSAGNIRPNVTVRVLEPASETPISQTIYVNDGGNQTYANPQLYPSGVIDFYLPEPQRVRLGVKIGTGTEVFFENVDIALSKDIVTADLVSFEPVGDLSSLTVQDVIEELAGDLQAHLDDTTDAHDASAISVTSIMDLSADNVQQALGGIYTKIKDHLDDTTDAHDASAISFVPTGDLSSTNVQDAIVELQSDAFAKYALKSDIPTGADPNGTDPETGEAEYDPKFSLQTIVAGPLSVSPNIVKPGLRVIAKATAFVFIARLDEVATGGPVVIVAKRYNGGVYANDIGTVTIPNNTSVGVATNLLVDCAKGDIIKFEVTAVGATTPGSDVNLSIDFIETPVPA